MNKLKIIKKYVLVPFLFLIFNCQSIDTHKVKSILNAHILETENIIADGDMPETSKHNSPDSIIVSYLYEFYAMNNKGDSVVIYPKRYFVFNKKNLNFREIIELRERQEFVHYRDLEAKKIRDSLLIIKKDSIIKVEQNKVLADITFGMSIEEYLKKKEKFMDKTKYLEYEWSNSIFANKIGDYKFQDIYGDFHDGKLYKIEIKGDLIHYNYYDIEMPKQVDAIKLPYIEKYGEPIKHFDIPKWHTMDNGYTYLVDRWEIGTKTIELRIERTGSYNQLYIKIFQPEVVEKIKLEIEKKEKDQINKATEML